jgi:ubiquinone/menaquinone biosynthesis C-methylase UbiE
MSPASEDWTSPLAELRRVLTPGGRLIVAVDSMAGQLAVLSQRRR